MENKNNNCHFYSVAEYFLLSRFLFLLEINRALLSLSHRIKFTRMLLMSLHLQGQMLFSRPGRVMIRCLPISKTRERLIVSIYSMRDTILDHPRKRKRKTTAGRCKDKYSTNHSHRSTICTHTKTS